MTETTRLYGTVGAERLWIEPVMVYETEIEPWVVVPDVVVEIEEWDVHPPQEHLPSLYCLLEWITEWTVENGEVGDDYDIDDATGDAEVQQAAEGLLNLIASKIQYRMAKTHLRSLMVTWDKDEQPLLDGKPMYDG